MNEILLAASWFVIGLSTATILYQIYIVEPLMKQCNFLRGQWLKSMENHLDLMLALMGVPRFDKEKDGSVKSGISDDFKKTE